MAALTSREANAILRKLGRFPMRPTNNHERHLGKWVLGTGWSQPHPEPQGYPTIAQAFVASLSIWPPWLDPALEPELLAWLTPAQRQVVRRATQESPHPE